MILRRACPLLLLFAALPLFAAGPADGQQELKGFDFKIASELARLNPAAVPLFEQANREREADQHAAAARDYAKVVELAPSFDHALRREAREEQLLGHRVTALTLQREALALHRSVFNLAGLAIMLADARGEIPADDAREARSLVVEALAAPDADTTTIAGLGAVALGTTDPELMDRVAGRLKGMKGGEPFSHYFHAFAIGVRGDLSGGRDELDLALKSGLPIEVYKSAVAGFDAARPLWQKVAIWSGWVFVPWLAGLALLFLFGLFLSRAALRASTELPAAENGASTEFGAALRRAYRAVIGIASVYYYLSVPIVLALTLLLMGGIIYACLAAGWIPVKIIVIAGFVAIVSVAAMVRGIFRRRTDEDPGEKLDLGQHPALRECLDTVAGRIGTRPVDNVYLTVGTDIAVMERGTWWRNTETKERCLILGVGVLDGFRLRPFKAVLAHEYGHFVNRDTAGGALAFAVNGAIFRSAMHVAQSGAATWYNPAWQFLRGYQRLFLRISHGASRFQEAMADRWSAFAYGSPAFETGLRHAVVRAIEFPQRASVSLNEAVNQKRAVVNLYTFQPETPANPADLERAVGEQLNDAGSPYDSHPPFAARTQWVHALNAAGDPPADDDDAEVWSLFSDRDAVERKMTEVVRENIRRERGIDIAHL